MPNHAGPAPVTQMAGAAAERLTVAEQQTFNLAWTNGTISQ